MAGDNKSNAKTPWKNGFYQSRSMKSMVYEVNGEKVLMYSASGKPSGAEDRPMCNATWTYGDFGDAHPEVQKESGKVRYNAEMNAMGGVWKIPMVITDDGKTAIFYGMAHCVDFVEWLSEEELAEAIATNGVPHDNMPHTFQARPGYPGKIVWLSGAPGLGKSTSAMLLGKNAGYVYYEADSFMNHMNPYVSTDADEPTLAMMTQKFLTGVPQERIDCIADGMGPFLDFIEGREYDFKAVCGFYGAMVKDIIKEQKRIGGDFAIAQAVPTRKIREYIQTQFGDNFLFVVLHMSKEDQTDRIKARHGDDCAPMVDMLTKCYDLYEPAGDDEKNAIHCLITKDMTRDDVVDKTLRLVKEHSK